MIKKLALERSTSKVKVTVNDVMMALLSKTLHDYLRQYKNDHTTMKIGVNLPFSLRPAPTAIGDWEATNQFSLIALDIPLCSDVRKCMIDICLETSALKNSLQPIGNAFLLKLVLRLPTLLRQAYMRYHYRQCTVNYSIVPQPKKAFSFHGS